MNEDGELPAEMVSLTAIFNEPVTAAAGALSLHNDSDDEDVDLTAATFVHVPNSDRARWDLEGVDIPYGRWYSATLAPGMITDSTGGQLDGDADGTPGGNHVKTFFVAIPGDANLDRAVDYLDYMIVKTSYGTGDQWAEGDFDGSGTVERGDVMAMRSQFGVSVPLAAPAPADEPDSAANAPTDRPQPASSTPPEASTAQDEAAAEGAALAVEAIPAADTTALLFDAPREAPPTAASGADDPVAADPLAVGALAWTTGPSPSGTSAAEPVPPALRSQAPIEIGEDGIAASGLTEDMLDALATSQPLGSVI